MTRVHRPGPVFAALIVVAVVTGVILGVDVSRLVLAAVAPASAEPAHALTTVSLVLQYVRTLVVFALVPLGWSAAPPGPDRLHILAAFALVLVADFLIILRAQLVAGVMVFLVVQLILIRRHTRGLGTALRDSAQRRTLSLLAVGLFVAWLASLPVLVGPLARAGILVPLGAYSVVLLASLMAAAATLVTGALSRRNALRATIGMALFAACDLTVALGAAYAGTMTGAVADAATGLVYGPALALLALSTHADDAP